MEGITGYFNSFKKGNIPHNKGKTFDELYGEVQSKIMKQNLSDKAKQRDRKPLTEEQKQNISIGKLSNPNSSKCSIETKHKLSIAQSKRMQSIELREQVSEKLKGIPKTESMKNKLRDFRLGKKIYNNSVINKFYVPGTEPNGFVIGSVKKME